MRSGFLLCLVAVIAFLPAGCGGAAETPIPLATWVAQEGVLPDTMIHYERLSRSDAFSGETIEIAAGGRCTLELLGPDGPMPTCRGRLSAEAVKSILSEFVAIDFFSVRGADCVYYVTRHPATLPTRPTFTGMQEFEEMTASITIHGMSHSVGYSYHYGEAQRCGDDPDALAALDRLGRAIRDAVAAVNCP